MLTIIGCGNPNRTDDGVGVVLAARLKRRLDQHPMPGVQVFDCGTAGMDVMFAARGSDALVLIDAATFPDGRGAGTVYEVPGAELESVVDPGYSLHDFRWDHALYAARRLFGDEMPEDVVVYLIEASSTELGLQLTAPVARAADDVYARVLDRMAQRGASRHAGAVIALQVKRGMLRIPVEAYDQFFEGRAGVIVLHDDAGPVLVPVASTHGGLVVKVRSARGDRAIDLSEVLLHHGWNLDDCYPCRARWDAERGGLALSRALEDR